MVLREKLRDSLCNYFTELHRGKAQSYTEIKREIWN